MRAFITMVGAVFVGMVLTIALLVMIDQTPSRSDLADRLDQIDQRLAFHSCLLLFEPGDRDQVTVAQCQSMEGQ